MINKLDRASLRNNTYAGLLFRHNKPYSEDVKLLLKLIEYNKEDIRDMLLEGLSEFKNKHNQEDILSSMKKKDKRVKIFDYNTGEYAFFRADIEDDPDTVMTISVPLTGKDPLAFLEFKNFPRVNKFKSKLRLIDTALKAARLTVKKTYGRHRRISSSKNEYYENFVRYSCIRPQDTERFWQVFMRISKM